MLNLWGAQRVVVVGGGTAGWFSALEMRRLFGKGCEVLVVESEQIGILGAGEGSLPNFDPALARYQLARDDFMHATDATYMLGVCFEGWRAAGGEHYHHVFSSLRDGVSLLDWQEAGFHPLASVLLNKGIPFERFSNAAALIRDQASQARVADHLATTARDSVAYHFDAHRLAAYLSSQARSRGVERRNAVVRSVRRDHRGDVAALLTDDGEISGDFFIDATGFRRLLMGESLQTPWTSYAPYLLLDSALPFLMPSRAAHPPLVTHSKALDAGWMWTIPTQGRLGCGYAYSSAHAGEQDALRELEAHWGGPVEPINRFRFEAGRLERCWSGNVMAVGLASGFVEPLEATSIGQTLSQLASFGDLVADTQGHVTQQSIDHFCHQTAAYWDGIRDFLVMHYDTPRADTAFWRDVRAAPRPASYLELKSAFGARTPRDIDFAQHAAGGRTMFGALSWMAIAAPMKLLKPDATLVELARLDKEKRERLLQFVEACLPGREAT